VSWLVDVGDDVRKVILMEVPARLFKVLPEVEVAGEQVERVRRLADAFLEREQFRLEAQAEIARLTDTR
jgi:hypothetical protein